MPHYADGTEAKVGDQVSGSLLNSDGIKAGVIISIAPGAESCNAQVQFTEVVRGYAAPRMAVMVDQGGFGPSETHERRPLARMVRTEKHGTEGPEVILFTCVDYCDVNKLTKLG